MCYYEVFGQLYFIRAVWEKLVNWENLVELRLECWLTPRAFVVIQSTPDDSNLQGKSKNVRVIGSSKKIAASKEKKQFLLHREHFNHI